ncbi:MAG: lysine-2,3-aminomutase-like protein [Cyanothece sp. SIO2G6]|nr:lysine-2,3-aminomutase-like protein [Cyanothece sp. SIO2G6]
MAKTLRSTKDLVSAGLVDEGAEVIAKTEEQFSIAITPAMKQQMQQFSTVTDPVARQFIPMAEELVLLDEELADPIGDDPYTKVKGITHRYPDRLLLKPLHTCSVYCRFCFRREKVGQGSEGLSNTELDAALDYIRTHPEVWEVILTGGDPLIMSTKRLQYIVQSLDQIEHVKVIRFHTRVPSVEPERVTDEVVRALKVKTAVYVVLHCNSAQEIGEPQRHAIAQLVDAGIPMLSQSVLLKGVNDTPEALEALVRTLVENRVKVYYLHHGDLAQGTSHFRTTIAEGQSLIKALRGNVSGVCQPLYVLDIPGGYGKVPLMPTYYDEAKGQVEDYQGMIHQYPPQVG